MFSWIYVSWASGPINSINSLTLHTLTTGNCCISRGTRCTSIKSDNRHSHQWPAGSRLFYSRLFLVTADSNELFYTLCLIYSSTQFQEFVWMELHCLCRQFCSSVAMITWGCALSHPALPLKALTAEPQTMATGLSWMLFTCQFISTNNSHHSFAEIRFYVSNHLRFIRYLGRCRALMVSGSGHWKSFTGRG